MELSQLNLRHFCSFKLNCLVFLTQILIHTILVCDWYLNISLISYEYLCLKQKSKTFLVFLVIIVIRREPTRGMSLDNPHGPKSLWIYSDIVIRKSYMIFDKGINIMNQYIKENRNLDYSEFSIQIAPDRLLTTIEN